MTRAKRQQPTNAKAVRGSDAARRSAALLLEAWSGVRSTTSASEAMGVALKDTKNPKTGELTTTWEIKR